MRAEPGAGRLGGAHLQPTALLHRLKLYNNDAYISAVKNKI